MTQAGDEIITEHFRQSLLLLEISSSSPALLSCICDIARLCVNALSSGGKLMLAGNGGSAADAQHIAGEFVSRLNFDRGPLSAIALTTDTSVMTAIGNDYGYDYIFERQVLALGRAGDVFIGISTSGKSPNVLRAMAVARSLGLSVVGFGGQDGGDMAAFCDLLLQVPSFSTPLIQQIHITAAHAVCATVEKAMYPDR